MKVGLSLIKFRTELFKNCRKENAWKQFYIELNSIEEF